mgnify:CR=1 FL=1
MKVELGIAQLCPGCASGRQSKLTRRSSATGCNFILLFLCKCLHTEVAVNPHVQELIDLALKYRKVAFDVEYDPYLSVKTERDTHAPDFDLHGCSFCCGKKSIYVKSKELCREITSILFAKPEKGEKPIQCIAFNGKVDIQWLKRTGWAESYPHLIVDPMIGMNLLEDNLHPNQLGLKTLIKKIFNHQMMEFQTAYKYGMDSKEFTKYAVADSYWEYRLWEWMEPQLKDQGLLKYLLKIPAIAVFADMEEAGLLWDLKEARKLLRGFQKIRSRLESEVFAELGGAIDLNSSKQLRQRLFTDLGYSTAGLERTEKTGQVSTGAKNLDILAKRHPACAKISQYRTAEKLINTYVVPLTEQAMNCHDGRIHPTFWLVSSTGRTRCEKPNLQNQPAYLDKIFDGLSIRKGFTARPGFKLLVSDLSQIELRLVAHFSKDSTFLDAYRNWQCNVCDSKGMFTRHILHKCPNCGVAENEDTLKGFKGFWHGLDLHQLTANNVKALHGDRQAGKTSNFALVYCATANRMHAEYPEFSKGRWEEVIADYMNTYSGVNNWHMRLSNILRTTAEYADIFGRKRRIPPQDVHKSYKHALNQLVNFGPQASACGMMQLSMTKMREHFTELGTWFKDIYPVNMVHDEIVFEVREEYIEDAIPVVVEYMENAVSIEVPCRTDYTIVDSWGDAK